MKVCLICPHFPTMSYPCGAADFTLGLAKALSAESEVSVLTANTKTVSVDNVVVHTIVGPWNFWKVLKLAHWIRKQAFDVIDIQFEAYMYGGRGAILLLPLLLPRKQKKILTLHSETLPTFGGRLWRLAQMKLFDHVVFYSQQFLTNTLARFRARESTFSLSPFPANISRYPDTTLKTHIQRHFKGTPGHKLYLSYFGHITQNRGIEYLVSSVSALKEQGIHLIFIGQFDPEKNLYHREISLLIKNLGLETSITFTGRLDEKEVSQIIELSDLGVLPFTEGASFKNGSLAAYVAHNVPVLTTLGPVTEAVLRENEGFAFFDLNAASSFEHQVLALLQDPERLSRMKASIADLDSLYSWKNYSEKRQTIYQKACT